MAQLTITCPEPFDVFTRRRNPGRSIVYRLNRRTSIKDIIESVGIPHTEIGSILADGRPVDFTFIPNKTGCIALEPVTAPFDVTRPTLLRPRPLHALRFVADVNVGKLAVLMRMVGLDTAYDPGHTDAGIAQKAESENRVVLSKDIGLLKRRQIHYGRYVRAVYPDDQLKEVLALFGIGASGDAFSRCLRCNSKLIAVDKAAIDHRLEPKTRKYYHRFMRCPVCDQIYWKGSHHDHMDARLRRMGLHIR